MRGLGKLVPRKDDVLSWRGLPDESRSKEEKDGVMAELGPQFRNLALQTWH